MDRGNIEVVSFDLDETLIRYTRSPGEVLQVSFDRVGVEPLFTVEEYYDRFDAFIHAYDSMDDLRAACFATLAADNGHDRELGRAVAEIYSQEREQSDVEFVPMAPALLDALVGEYRLAIVTNGPGDGQRAKIEATNLDRWVETVVVAGDDTPPKPDPQPFIRMMASLDASPATTVHVGDSLDTDVRGATAAGLASIWISNAPSTGEVQPTLRVGSLRELWGPLLDRDPPEG